MASTDARPVPQKNVAFRATFPIWKTDGTLITGAAGLDSEVSKDAGTFADATSEATEIATSSGIYYLDLTSTEMNADCVAVIVKSSTTGAETTVLVFYPEEAGDIRVNATQINSVSASSVTTINANVGTTQPTNFTGTAGSALVKSDMVDIAGAAVSASTAQIGVNVVNNAGSAITAASGIQEVKVASIAANAITATSINADAITDAKVAADVTIASVTGAVGSVTGAVGSVTGNLGGNVTGSVGSVATGGITSSSYAAGAIDNAAIAADAIGSSELATSAVNEIADAILDRDMSVGADNGTSTVRTVRQALRFLRNKWAVSGGALTVYKEDDSTSSWTGAVSTDAAADPIIGNDPAGP